MTPEVREVDYDEGAEILDRRARQLLGISGTEFLERWSDCSLGWDSTPDVTAVAMLIPFARP